MVNLSNFPALVPAFILSLAFPPTLLYEIGTTTTGVHLEIVPSDNTSTLISVSGYPLQASSYNSSSPINGSLIFGSNAVHVYSDYETFDYSGVVQTQDNALLYLTLHGTTVKDNNTQYLFPFNPRFNGTQFGSGFAQVGFQTSAPQYKFLEDAIFVATSRYVVTQVPGGETFTLEFPMSQVMQG